MRAGRLDRLITIQRKSDGHNEVGEPVPTWADVTHREPASVSPVSGTERFGDQFVAKEQKEFRIRWCEALASLSPLDRIIYPAPDSVDVQAPSLSQVYDIMAVHEIGRHEGLQILAARHSDAP